VRIGTHIGTRRAGSRWAMAYGFKPASYDNFIWIAKIYWRH
jgi:hypothetical protein